MCTERGSVAAGAADRERGTATAELALAVPALVLLTALCVAAVGAVATHVRCLDAARSGARTLARGEPVDLVREVVAARAPAGAHIRLVHRDDDLVAVQVHTRVRLGGRGNPGLRVGGEVVAVAENVGSIAGPAP
jgi:hypothetical protein